MSLSVPVFMDHLQYFRFPSLGTWGKKVSWGRNSNNNAVNIWIFWTIVWALHMYLMVAFLQVFNWILVISERLMWLVHSLSCLWDTPPANEDWFWRGSMRNTLNAGSLWSWLLIPPLINTAWSKVFRGHLSHLASDTRWQMLCISGPADQYVIREQPLGGMSINSGLSATLPVLCPVGLRESGGCLFNLVPVEDLWL